MAGIGGVMSDAFGEQQKRQGEILREMMTPHFTSTTEWLFGKHVSTLQLLGIGDVASEHAAAQIRPVVQSLSKSLTRSVADQVIGLGANDSWKSFLTADRILSIAATVPADVAERSWEAAAEEAPAVIEVVEEAYAQSDAASQFEAGATLAAITSTQIRWASYVALISAFSFALYLLGMYLPPEAMHTLNLFVGAYGMVPKPDKKGDRE